MMIFILNHFRYHVIKDGGMKCLIQKLEVKKVGNDHLVSCPDRRSSPREGRSDGLGTRLDDHPSNK